jgi:hypothetical protein
MSFQECGAASISKFNEDLAAVLPIPATFYQSALFKAINGAHHCCGVNSQATGDAANSTWISVGALASLNQSHNHKLRRAKPLLVRMLESHPHNFAQVREDYKKTFNLLIEQ